MAVMVWTGKRKWLGNLVPALFWLVPTAAGLWLMVVRREIIGLGLWLLILGTVLGWLTLNLFGLWDNARMKRELGRILNADADLPKDRVFVGFASPKYTGLVDAHEDVGFLCFRPDSLLFVGEARTVELKKEDVRRVRFRPNAHTTLLLGRWVSVEGEHAGKPVRLQIEPRERRTMLGNLLTSGALRRKIEAWRKA